MRSYSQKTDGGQMLYKQIWEAIVWSYVIEYADFDVKKAYKSELTTEGYHQGGLGKGVFDEQEMRIYTDYQKLTPNDYTLSLGNHTGNKNRGSRMFNVPVGADHYWDYYTIDNSGIVSGLDNSYKVLSITGVMNPNTDYNIKASGDDVGGTVKYKITGLVGDQTIVFKREKGNLAVTTDGTYDVEWGTNNVERKIYFSDFQTSCNITIEIVDAPAYDVIKNQISWNIPHYRGFNVFWYGDIKINVDNTLTKYDANKQKTIWYYTDDITKFSNDITNKEHQIEVGKTRTNWLREIKINNKGDIVPSKVTDDTNYKQSYYSTDIFNSYAAVGGDIVQQNNCNILTISTEYPIDYIYSGRGFVKVTILDN